MKEFVVVVSMTILAENEKDAFVGAQRWLPYQRELPLTCSDGVTLTDLKVNQLVIVKEKE